MYGFEIVNDEFSVMSPPTVKIQILGPEADTQARRVHAVRGASIADR